MAARADNQPLVASWSILIELPILRTDEWFGRVSSLGCGEPVTHNEKKAID
jgi:hypothetical protein